MIISIKAISMNKSLGFTLVEVLVAMVIFAILATLSTYAMQKLLQSYAKVNTNQQEWNQLDKVIHELDNNLKHFVRRPITSQDKRQFPVFIGQPDYIEWTYASHADKLKHAALLCKDQQLIRRNWPVLDPLDRKTYQDTVLLDNLNECRFRYLNHRHQVSGYWEQNFKKSPKGVALILKWHHQSINFWFNMAPYYYVG